MQPFAPTPYLHDPISSSGINLHEEIKLFTTPHDRDLYDSLSVLFSILVSLDFLESFHLRDSITPEAYHSRCQKLISQYTSYSATLNKSDYSDVDDFCKKYKVHYPLAVARLKAGVPAPDILFSPSPPPVPTPIVVEPVASVPERVAKSARPAKVAETVQNFITLMDALKLSFRAKDQLHPLLSDLMSSITPSEDESEVELEGRGKLVKWLIRINQMKVSEEIDEEEARELFFEVEGLYGEYLKTL